MNAIRTINRNFHNWWRIVIIPIVVLMSAFLAFKGGRLESLVIFALPVVLCGVIFLRQPQWGLIAVIPVSMLVPIEFATGEVSTLNITIVLIIFLLALWVIDMLIIKRSFSFLTTPSIVILIAFSIIVLLSFLMGFLPWFSNLSMTPITGQLAGMTIFFVSFGAFVLVAHQMKEIRWLKWMVWIFLIFGGIYMVVHRISLLGYSLGSLFQYTATRGVFWIWLVAMAISQALINKDLSSNYRIALVGLVLITLFLAVFRYRGWVSGWLPPLITLVVILWMIKPRLALIVTLILIPIIIFNWDDIIQILLYEGDEYKRNWWSLVSRQEAWKIVLENIVSKNPVLGIGPAGYYYQVANYSIFGYFVPFNSHHQYIDLLAQTGFLGLICYLLFILEIGRLGLRLLPKLSAGFSRAYVVAVLGGTVGTLAAGFLADWIIPFLYNVGLSGVRASVLSWLFWGGLVVIHQHYLDP